MSAAPGRSPWPGPARAEERRPARQGRRVRLPGPRRGLARGGGGHVHHRDPAARCQRAHIELAWCTTGRGAWAGRGGGPSSSGGGGGEDVEEPGGGSPLHGDPAGAPERPEGRASPGRPRERPRPGRAVLRALCVGLPRPPRRRLPKIRSCSPLAQPLSGVLVLRCTLP
ncbi:unnamed protein product [Prorocentrum cordatum]|uniref:Uncharacterized protein n=1 Tax=Prorocentrum cordatum TaxID=2364126 RepID=A0ABN9PQC6_9DINO|nr:unnamed protein product [Polarella glacialis]